MNLKISLAGIEKRYLDIYAAINENDEEISEEMLEVLNINDNEFEEKLIVFNTMIESAESEIAYSNRIIEGLNKKIKVRNNFIEFLKESIIKTTKKVSTPTLTPTGLQSYKMKFKSGLEVNLKPSQSVKILDEFEIEDLGLGKFAITLSVKDNDTVKIIKNKFPEAKSKFVPSLEQVKEKILNKELDENIAKLQTNHSLRIKF